jgi:hypothetical protein
MLRFAPLLFIIFIEGYAVLASELIAIRGLISYVGNGSDIVSIIIAGVLLPLAAGYYYGGMTAHNRKPVRARLIRNFTLALLFLVLGLSPVGMDTFFMGLSEIGITNRLLLAPLYVLVFLIPPTFLLGQTIPLSARLFRDQTASRIAGHTLLWSTVGSFLGSIFSTLVLMAFFGVHVAVLFVAILLLIAIAMLNRKLTLRTMGVPALLVLVCLLLNASFIFSAAHIYYQNQYNTARILTTPKNDSKLLSLNKAPSAGYNPTTDGAFPSITQAEELLLKPLLEAEPKRDILVLGAGGFTFGRNDTHNHYTYVDIDPDLKELTEKFFLQKTLTANKKFVPEAARAFLVDALREGKKFDLVYIDAFNGEMWVPEDLVTQDFFGQVREVLKPDGIASANMVLNPTYADDYSRNLDHTFDSVFPATLRFPVTMVDVWSKSPDYRLNVLYIGFKAASEKAVSTYTDNKNRVFWDKPLNRNR